VPPGRIVRIAGDRQRLAARGRNWDSGVGKSRYRDFQPVDDRIKEPIRMTASWKDVRRASIPLGDLPVLAELRGREAIRVLTEGDLAWVSWEPGSELMQEMLVRRILPLAGATLYTQRGGHWYRLAEHLPRFDVPTGDGSDWPTLERTIFPEPVQATRPQRRLQHPIRIRLVRDGAMPPRPASALRCRSLALAAWAERATSAALCAVSGAWIRPGAPGGTDGLVLLTAPAEFLPPLEEGVRFWGTELLLPLGFRAEPDLPHPAIRRAAGATNKELAVLDDQGIEVIPRAVFAPLSRAAVRLMLMPGRGDAGRERPR
jgi:MoxR-vWA-beta-propeller ternary system domain bpX2